MSAQRTNSIFVIFAVIVAAAIVVFAIVNRTNPTPTVEGEGGSLPAETLTGATDQIEPVAESVTHIDQTTDTTHAPATPDLDEVDGGGEAVPDTGADGASNTPPTTLIAAASRGDIKAVTAMVAAGHDLDATDEGGRTALMAAAGGGHVDAVFVLLNAGADPALRDAARRAARDYALSRYDKDGQTIARILGDAVGPLPVLDAGEK